MSMVDAIDTRILEMLQQNGRVTQVDISRDVGLAPSAVLERIRKLEARGIIKGYTAIVDPAVARLGLLAFVAVQSSEAPWEDRVGRELALVPEVLEVHHVAGDDCFFVKISAHHAEHLGELLKSSIGRIDGVRSTRTTIVLGSFKESTELPLTTQEATESLAS